MGSMGHHWYHVQAHGGNERTIIPSPWPVNSHADAMGLAEWNHLEYWDIM